MNNRIRQKLIWKKYIKHHYFPIHELTDEVMAKLIDREEGVIMEEMNDLMKPEDYPNAKKTGYVFNEKGYADLPKQYMADELGRILIEALKNIPNIQVMSNRVDIAIIRAAKDLEKRFQNSRAQW